MPGTTIRDISAPHLGRIQQPEPGPRPVPRHHILGVALLGQKGDPRQPDRPRPGHRHRRRRTGPVIIGHFGAIDLQHHFFGLGVQRVDSNLELHCRLRTAGKKCLLDLGGILHLLQNRRTDAQIHVVHPLPDPGTAAGIDVFQQLIIEEPVDQPAGRKQLGKIGHRHIGPGRAVERIAVPQRLLAERQHRRLPARIDRSTRAFRSDPRGPRGNLRRPAGQRPAHPAGGLLELQQRLAALPARGHAREGHLVQFLINLLQLAHQIIQLRGLAVGPVHQIVQPFKPLLHIGARRLGGLSGCVFGRADQRLQQDLALDRQVGSRLNRGHILSTRGKSADIQHRFVLVQPGFRTDVGQDVDDGRGWPRQHIRDFNGVGQ